MCAPIRTCGGWRGRREIHLVGPCAAGTRLHSRSRPGLALLHSFTRSLAHTPADLSRDRGYAAIPEDNQERARAGHWTIYIFFHIGGGMLYSWLCFRAVLWPRQAPAIFTSGSIISHHLADTCLSSDKPMKRSEIRAYRVVTHREANKRRWRRGRVGVAHRHCRRVATRGRCVHRVPRASLRARMVQAACTGWPQNHTCC